MKVLYLHNILWSTYRLTLFNALASRLKKDDSMLVLQYAATEKRRLFLQESLNSLIRHPYHLVYEGSYDDLSILRRSIVTLRYSVFFSFDIVVLTGYASIESWIMLFISKILRRKVLLAVDSSEFEFNPTSKLNLLKKFFLYFTDGALAYGKSSENLLKRLGYTSSIAHPFHCVSEDYYLYDQDLVVDQKKSAAEFGFMFIYVGRLSIEKGLLDLIESFSVAFGVRRDIFLRIIGAGPLQKECELKIKELNVSNISLEGPLVTQDLTKVYAQANCLVLPSTLEPWGLVVNESLCLGTPVVVSNKCGCVPDLVELNKNAISFKAADRMDLQNALEEAVRRFGHFDELRVRECMSFGRAYSPERAANTFFQALTVLSS